MVSLFLLGGAIAEDGLFGDVTAAWVQALGSIGAIIAAIAVDQGAARRLREDRKEARADAVRARLAAIESGARTVELLAGRFEKDAAFAMQGLNDFRGALNRARTVIERQIERGEMLEEVEVFQLWARDELAAADTIIQNYVGGQRSSELLLSQTKHQLWALAAGILERHGAYHEALVAPHAVI